MTRLRIWFALLIVWLVALCANQLAGGPVQLDPLVLGLAALAATLAVVWPRVARWPVWVALAPLPVYLGAQWLLDQPLGGERIPLTLTECGVLALSAGLARRASLPLVELHDLVSGSMIRHLRDSHSSFDTGQGEIYREIQRARRHHRPLALLSIAPAPGQTRVPAPLIEQIQRETVQRYVRAQIADLLSEECDDYDVVTYRDDHFVTLLPETGREEAFLMAKRIATAAEERLGLAVRVGVSTFPDEEVTFDKLLETAEAAMRRSQPTPVSLSSSGPRELRATPGSGTVGVR